MSRKIFVSQHASWTASYVDSLPDSAFAFIDYGGKKDSDGKTTPRSLRHFPYKDAQGKLDEAHTRNALARVPQSHVSAVGKHAALVKLHAAARTLGIKLTAADGGGMGSSPAADGSSNEPKGSTFPRNAYESIMGFLGLNDRGEGQQPEETLPPGVAALPEGLFLSLSEGDPEQETVINGMATPAGRLRYWAVASNNFYDNKGKEFPEAAQQEYVDWVWGAPEKRMAELQIWHTPGTRLGQDDWVDFDGHFLHSTGLIDVGREELARKYASDPEIAMSHGYIVVWDGHERAVAFRSYEKSILPRQYAGNSFTSFGLEEDNVAFSDPRKKFLREAGLSDADITAREVRWEQFGKAVEALGVGFHELDLYVASIHAEEEDATSTSGAAGAVVTPTTAASGAAPATPAPPADGAAPAVAADQQAAAGGLATEGMTVESLRLMLSSIVAEQISPIQQQLHAVQAAQQGVDEATARQWAGRPRPAGFDPTKSPATVPTVAVDANGQPTLVQQHGSDGVPLTPLDPSVLRTIAAGVESGKTNGESAITWMEDRLKAQHPMFNGQPTEHRR